MPILSKPSGAARTAVTYVTIGALIEVWSIVWYIWLTQHASPERTEAAFYWCYGFLLTGLVLLAIGFALGRIGRAARHAELPPDAPANVTAEPPANAMPPGAPNGQGPNGPAAPYFPSSAPVALPAQPAVPVAIAQATPPKTGR